jgi:hypothetical protein
VICFNLGLSVYDYPLLRNLKIRHLPTTSVLESIILSNGTTPITITNGSDTRNTSITSSGINIGNNTVQVNLLTKDANGYFIPQIQLRTPLSAENDLTISNSLIQNNLGAGIGFSNLNNELSLYSSTGYIGLTSNTQMDNDVMNTLSYPTITGHGYN